MSGFTGPKDMDGILDNALATLHSSVVSSTHPTFPKDKILDCSGIALLNTKEIGALVAAAKDSSGVVLVRSSSADKWSPPLPIAMTGMGIGSLGYAEKQTVLLLNQAAVNSLALGKDAPIKFGADAGLASGAVGGEVGTGRGVGATGLQSAYAYSNTEGGMISLQIRGCVIKPMEKIIAEYYPGKTVSDVLEGKVDIPKDSKAAQLMANVEELTKP